MSEEGAEIAGWYTIFITTILGHNFEHVDLLYRIHQVKRTERQALPVVRELES